MKALDSLLLLGGAILLFGKKAQAQTVAAKTTSVERIVAGNVPVLDAKQTATGYQQPVTGTAAAAFTGGAQNNPAALGGYYALPVLSTAQIAAGGFNAFFTVAPKDAVAVSGGAGPLTIAGAAANTAEQVIQANGQAGLIALKEQMLQKLNSQAFAQGRYNTDWVIGQAKLLGIDVTPYIK